MGGGEDEKNVKTFIVDVSSFPSMEVSLTAAGEKHLCNALIYSFVLSLSPPVTTLSRRKQVGQINRVSISNNAMHISFSSVSYEMLPNADLNK